MSTRLAIAVAALFTFLGLYQIYKRLERLEKYLPPFTPTAPDKVMAPAAERFGR